MYRRPELYDAIYSYKDYAREAEIIHGLIQKYKCSDGNKLLDIACGTGLHIEHLKKHYECEGLDLSQHLLKAAEKRNPECNFMKGDMMFFDVGRWFDAVICLFSAIGYVKTFEALESTLARFAIHAAPGGVVIVEPWLFPENFTDGFMGLDTVDKPNYKVARISTSHKSGQLSVLEFEFLVAKAGKVERISNRSELGLFSVSDYTEAMTKAGLEVTFDPEGLWSRGLFIGRKPR